MEKNPDTKISSEEKNDQDYPDVILPVGPGEDSEEENPMAFPLLTKIEDPYYLRKGSPGKIPPSNKEGNNFRINSPFYRGQVKLNRL